MGTFLKVVGVLALIWFGLAAAGCAMIWHAASGGGSSSIFGSAFHETRERSDVMDALRDGDVDIARLPSDLESASEVTVTLRDGSTHVLKNTPADRIVRATLAAKAQSATRQANYEAASSYSNADSRPHFKPGEPMMDPNPGGNR